MKKSASFFVVTCFLALALLNIANTVGLEIMNTVWIASSLWLLSDSVAVHQDMEVAQRVNNKIFEDKLNNIIRQSMVIAGHHINNKLADTMEQAMLYIYTMSITQPPPPPPVFTRARTC